MDRKPLSGGEQAEQRNPDNQMVGFCPWALWQPYSDLADVEANNSADKHWCACLVFNSFLRNSYSAKSFLVTSAIHIKLFFSRRNFALRLLLAWQ